MIERLLSFLRRQQVDHYFAPTMEDVCQELNYDMVVRGKTIENFTVYKTENGF